MAWPEYRPAPAAPDADAVASRVALARRSVLALSVIAAAIVTMPPSVDEVVPQIAPQADLDTTLVLRAARKLVDDLQAAQTHGRPA